jgi:hypothetical protein
MSPAENVISNDSRGVLSVKILAKRTPISYTLSQRPKINVFKYNKLLGVRNRHRLTSNIRVPVSLVRKEAQIHANR